MVKGDDFSVDPVSGQKRKDPLEAYRQYLEQQDAPATDAAQRVLQTGEGKVNEEVKARETGQQQAAKRQQADHAVLAHQGVDTIEKSKTTDKPVEMAADKRDPGAETPSQFSAGHALAAAFQRFRRGLKKKRPGHRRVEKREEPEERERQGGSGRRER